MLHLSTARARIGLGLLLGLVGALVIWLAVGGGGGGGGSAGPPTVTALATGVRHVNVPAPAVRSSAGPKVVASAAVKLPARPPRAFKDEAGVARHLFAAELGATAGIAQPRVMGAACVAGRCVVRYRVDEKGPGALLADQVPIWRALFADPRTQVVTLLAHHTFDGNSRTKSEGLPIMEITCTRAQLGHVNWASPDFSNCLIYTGNGGNREAFTGGHPRPMNSNIVRGNPHFAQSISGPGPPGGRGR